MALQNSYTCSNFNRFDFSGKSGPIPCEEQTLRKAKSVCKGGSSSAVFMWWELKMDPARNITLSCAPHWAHPKVHY